MMHQQGYSVLTLKTKDGRTLDAFAGDSITTEIQEKGEYDSNTLDSIRYILDLINPRTSLDIGANIGNHALVIGTYSQRLVAFEPVPFIYQLLARNLEQNGLSQCSALNVGLSNEAIARDIFIPDYGNLGCSSLEHINAEGTRVRINTLIGDTYLEISGLANQIDFIKIDVEGHEPAALTGLAKTLAEQTPLILMEYRNENTLALFQDQSLFNQLFPNYRIYSLSSTTSKKLYLRGMSGFFKRMLAKLKGGRWCLSDFDPKRRYSNIYLVPQRYQPLFEKLPYLASR